MRQQRIFGIIILCLVIKELEGKALRTRANVNEQNQRVKRGYSKYGENEYGPSIHVSSPVLHYANADETGSLDTGSHFEASSVHEDPWQSSGLSPGYDVWLEPSNSYHPSPSIQDLHTSSIAASHPGSDYISNSVFSDDSAHNAAHIELPSSPLHTQIISSGGHSDISGHVGSGSHIAIGDHSISAISDNVDFNNIADIKSKHYSKSYGK